MGQDPSLEADYQAALNSATGNSDYNNIPSVYSSGSNPSVWNSAAPWSAIQSAISSASGILGARYAVPQLNPGQMIQSGPYGSTMYQAPTGAGAFSMPGLPMLGSMDPTTLMMIAGGGLVLFMVMSRH